MQACGGSWHGSQRAKGSLPAGCPPPHPGQSLRHPVTRPPNSWFNSLKREAGRSSLDQIHCGPPPPRCSLEGQRTPSLHVSPRCRLP